MICRAVERNSYDRKRDLSRICHMKAETVRRSLTTIEAFLSGPQREHAVHETIQQFETVTEISFQTASAVYMGG